MNAPDRQTSVAVVVSAHAELFAEGEDGRRKILAWICAVLNPADHHWGLLEKLDRSPSFIPADVLVWHPTGEHFDVLTDDGPTWIPRGVIPAVWRWIPAPVPDAAPSPTPVPVPTPGSDRAYDEAQVLAFQSDVAQAYADVGRQVDFGNVVHSARMQFDAATSLGYTASRVKHLRELREQLGLK